MRALAATLSRREVEAITNGQALEDVIFSYKEEIGRLKAEAEEAKREAELAHRDAGVWQLRANTAEQKLKIAQAEVISANEHLRAQIEENEKQRRVIQRLNGIKQSKKSVPSLKNGKPPRYDVGYIGEN